MAFELAYTSPDGVDHTKAYWRVVQINMSIVDKTAQVVLYAYRDKEASAEGKANIGQKTYSISGDQYDEYFAAAIVQVSDHITQAYKLAQEFKDVEVETEELGEDGKPITEKKSFFADAINV